MTDEERANEFIDWLWPGSCGVPQTVYPSDIKRARERLLDMFREARQVTEAPGIDLEWVRQHVAQGLPLTSESVKSLLALVDFQAGLIRDLQTDSDAYQRGRAFGEHQGRLTERMELLAAIGMRMEDIGVLYGDRGLKGLEQYLECVQGRRGDAPKAGT